jgi:hypothetical protein
MQMGKQSPPVCWGKVEGTGRSSPQAGGNNVSPNAFHPDCGPARLLGQQISINLLVAVPKKDRLPTIPTLRNVMRNAANHCTRQSCHGENEHGSRNRD